MGRAWRRGERTGSGPGESLEWLGGCRSDWVWWDWRLEEEFGRLTEVALSSEEALPFHAGGRPETHGLVPLLLIRATCVPSFLETKCVS